MARWLTHSSIRVPVTAPFSAIDPSLIAGTAAKPSRAKRPINARSSSSLSGAFIGFYGTTLRFSINGIASKKQTRCIMKLHLPDSRECRRLRALGLCAPQQKRSLLQPMRESL
jgi:hypothetical protein